MTRIKSYLDGAAAASAMLAAEIQSLRTEMESLARQVRSRVSDVSHARAKAASALGRAERFERVPILGRLLSRNSRAEVVSASGRADRAEAETTAIKALGRKARDEALRLTMVSDELRDSLRAARVARHVPDAVLRNAEEAGNRASFLRRRGRAKRADVLLVCSQLIEVGKEMRRLPSSPASACPAPGQAPTPARVQGNDAVTRIYLPVPFSMQHAARRAGAFTDPQVRVGSRMYVKLGMDLAPFERMLPLSFRRHPPRLSFPPVRPGAAGQAIWGVFDRQT